MKRFLLTLMVTVASGAALADEAVLNGSRMYYEDRGRGEPVVLLHGFTLDSRMWDQQRPLARNYRLVAADMRFHGRSAAVETSAFTAAEAADDVVALLDHLKIDRAHLVGLSMGAGYALETALRHPDRVRSLTLASASVQGMRTPPQAMASFMKGIEAYRQEGGAGFRRHWMADPLFAGVNAKPELRRRLQAMVEAYAVDALMRVMGKVQRPAGPTQLERLSQVKVPTLVMIGGRDQPHLIQAGETAARDITGARKVVYPAAGHMINMEEPKRFNRDLEAFLASLPRVGARDRAHLTPRGAGA